MSTEQTRVVVTGLGAVTPLGDDVASTWSALLAGKSGVRRLDDGLPDEIPVRIAAPAMVDPASVISRVQSRRLDRCARLALIAARQAWQDAGVPQVEPERLGVTIASGIGTTVEAYQTLNERGWQRLFPVHHLDVHDQRRGSLDQHGAWGPGRLPPRSAPARPARRRSGTGCR